MWKKLDNWILNTLEFTSKLKLDKILASPNLAEELSREELDNLGRFVVDGYKRDKESRVDWEERMADAFKLAMQVKEEKSFPWPGASNVKFPLITIAALQYHARAYPALLPSPEVVKCAVYGEDPKGEREARAKRISDHMSFQVMEEDETWEEHMDRVLITQPIVGCVFKKSVFNTNKNHNVSEFVLPSDLVVDYWTKSLDTAERVSHVIRFCSNEIRERVIRGVFFDWGEEWKDSTTPTTQNEVDATSDEAHGVHKSDYNVDNPFELIEQHTYLDLDGDGYKEPYIVTVRLDTNQVLRVVARFFEESITEFDGKIVDIKAEQYFTKFPFIPSPDGSFYDLGFGLLLGGLSASIDTSINQLIDAGTMSNTGGGFLGRGVKVKGGDYEFKPNEWKRVDSTGDDLRKNIFPLPTKEPSPVLFQLLSLLVDYGQRIAFATEATSGINPGQNTPAETSRNMLEQGLQIFRGIYKRTYRSLKEEFKKLFRLNVLYYKQSLEKSKSNIFIALPDDYDSEDILIKPAADPTMISDNHKQQRAMMLKQQAMNTPGYNRYEVEKRLLEAFQVSDIDKVFPDPKGPNAVPPPANPKVQIEQMKLELEKQKLQMQQQQAVLSLQEEARLNQAKMMKLEAEAIKLLKEAEGVDTGHQIAIIQAQIGAAKSHQDSLLRALDIMQREVKSQREGAIDHAANQARMGGVENSSSNGSVLQPS